MEQQAQPAGGARAPAALAWAVADDTPLPTDPIERLVYYARLAPSTRNTQPWRFVLAPSAIGVFADSTRWLKVADPSRRELHASIGCAIESLRVAADYAGFGTAVDYFPLADERAFVARVAVAHEGPPRPRAAPELLRYLIRRRTCRKPFGRERPVSDEDRRHLYCSFEVGDVSLQFLHERPLILALAELEEAADRQLFAQTAYREERARWARDGLSGAQWLASAIGELAAVRPGAAERLALEDGARIVNAPLAALLSTRGDTPRDAVQAGEAYMRLALVAESRGVRVQPMSQVLEVPETRRALAGLCQLGARVPQQLFRMGHAEAESGPRQRRPLASMITREAAPEAKAGAANPGANG